MKTKIISIVMAVAVSAGICSFAACSNGENTENAEQTVTIYDFERGTFGVGMAATFGKIELNRAEEYVSSGKSSLKLMPSSEKSKAPYMYLAFSSSKLGFSYTDITELKSVNLKIYAEKASTVNVGLYFSKAAEVKSLPEIFTLSQGWNEIVYEPNYTLISIQANLDECYGTYLSFDGDVAELPAFYLDDVSLTHARVEWVQENLIRPKRTEEYQEICDFENAYQNLMFMAYGNSGTLAPALTVVNANDYEGVTAPSGEKMLKLQIFPKDNATENTWTQVTACSPLLEAIDFSRFVDDIDSYRFCMDVYQFGDDNDQRPLSGNINLIELNLYTSSGSMDWGGLTTKKGEWVSYSTPLSTFKNFVASPGKFMFAFLDPIRDGEYVWFFDNIRIEKIA